MVQPPACRQMSEKKKNEDNGTSTSLSKELSGNTLDDWTAKSVGAVTQGLRMPALPLITPEDLCAADMRMNYDLCLLVSFFSPTPKRMKKPETPLKEVEEVNYVT
ncbi:serine-rich single-pass membrane protein 1 isoform X2 [Kogia breviceps]|uniref:serine-rich single-pass membrane protein 1 isoform X2 n=1 Tax=Kogia breviceps TaxID=27615 RepID=UPI0034D2DFAC